MIPNRNPGEVRATAFAFKIFFIALVVVVGTVAALFENNGTESRLLLIALLPVEVAVLYCSGRSLYRHHRDEVEEIAETKAASDKMPCPNCGRENSVLTRICPRCDQKLR
jgi:hypothetical protein